MGKKIVVRYELDAEKGEFKSPKIKVGEPWKTGKTPGAAEAATLAFPESIKQDVVKPGKKESFYVGEKGGTGLRTGSVAVDKTGLTLVEADYGTSEHAAGKWLEHSLKTEREGTGIKEPGEEASSAERLAYALETSGSAEVPFTAHPVETYSPETFGGYLSESAETDEEAEERRESMAKGRKGAFEAFRNPVMSPRRGMDYRLLTEEERRAMEGMEAKKETEWEDRYSGLLETHEKDRVGGKTRILKEFGPEETEYFFKRAEA